MDKRIKKLELIKCGKAYGYLVNGKYEVWLDNGTCYNTTNGGNLPQYIFKFRDLITNL